MFLLLKKSTMDTFPHLSPMIHRIAYSKPDGLLRLHLLPLQFKLTMSYGQPPAI